jgi:predicted dehydrogenase
LLAFPCQSALFAKYCAPQLTQKESTFMAVDNTQAAATKIGIIGCGNISRAYFKGCGFFPNLEIAACADLNTDLAREKAKEWGVPRGGSVEELLADPEIEIVVNLTIPAAHALVDRQILEAGKHSYSEKPFAVEREDGRKVLALADEKGLRTGCAPDTFLGGGIQTCIKLIEDGWIGTPVAATAFMLSSGPESWHPNPTFYYQKGGGPMFDMGPYYLTALISMLGPVRRITGSTRVTRQERVATGESTYGLKIPVETPTHVAAVLDFHSGPIATLVTSFDVQAHALPNIEIYGSEGTLRVPDPNTFGGPILIKRAGASEWSDVPILHASTEPGRGTGVADMSAAIKSGRPHRANGAMAYHVLDLMHAVHDASDAGHHIELQSSCEKPAPLPTGDVREAVL